MDAKHFLTIARGPLSDAITTNNPMIVDDDKKKMEARINNNEIIMQPLQRCHVVFKSLEELIFKEKEKKEEENDDSLNAFYRQLDGIHL